MFLLTPAALALGYGRRAAHTTVGLLGAFYEGFTLGDVPATSKHLTRLRVARRLAFGPVKWWYEGRCHAALDTVIPPKPGAFFADVAEAAIVREGDENIRTARRSEHRCPAAHLLPLDRDEGLFWCSWCGTLLDGDLAHPPACLTSKTP